MSYSILKQGPLTKKPIFFLIGGFIAVAIFFTVLFSLKEQDKLNEINEYLEKINKDEDTFNTIKKEVIEFKDRYPTRDLILKLIKNIFIHEDGNIDIYFNFKELNFIYNKRDAW